MSEICKSVWVRFGVGVSQLTVALDVALVAHVHALVLDVEVRVQAEARGILSLQRAVRGERRGAVRGGGAGGRWGGREEARVRTTS